MEDALALGRLREACGTTQVELAGALGVTQANVSRIEHQDDLYLSTLREYVEALGGRLQVAAIFDDQTILLTTPGRQTEPQEREQRAGREGDVSVSASTGGRE
jgi:transcriptional regulator with XRE-family HTH domain